MDTIYRLEKYREESELSFCHVRHILLPALMTVLWCIAVIFAAAKPVQAYDDIVVVIDPGHGGEVTQENSDSNAGAVYHDLMEKDVNLATALALRDELVQYGNVQIYLTREEDKEMSLEERVDFAKSVDADVIVSIHYNESNDHNFYGSEIFTSAFDRYYSVGHGLGECIMDCWKDYGNIEKDIKTRIGSGGDDYYGLIRLGREADIPTIILEHGYLDNDKDYLRLGNETAWTQMGIIDAKGIARYWDLEKDLVKTNIEPTVNVDIPDEPVMPDDSAPTGVRLVIDDYNSTKGDLSFTLYAYDDESKLMYYGFVTDEADEDTVFEELETWNGKNGLMKGTYHVQPGYKGPITASVYNVYELNGVSNVEQLEADESLEQEESDSRLVGGKNSTGKDNAAKDTGEAEAENTDGRDTVGDASEMPANSEETENEEIEIVGRRETVDKSIDEAMKKAIDEDTYSTVKDSYSKLVLVGLGASIVLAVGIVLAVSAAHRKSKKRKRNSREKKSYDWMDD